MPVRSAVPWNVCTPSPAPEEAVVAVVALDEPAVVVDDELLELQAANPKATSTNNMPATRRTSHHG